MAAASALSSSVTGLITIYIATTYAIIAWPIAAHPPHRVVHTNVQEHHNSLWSMWVGRCGEDASMWGISRGVALNEVKGMRGRVAQAFCVGEGRLFFALLRTTP